MELDIAVDLGNTGTRVFAVATDNKGIQIKNVFLLDNTYAIERKKAQIEKFGSSELYTAENSNAITLNVPQVENLRGTFVTGKITELYSKTSFKPTTLGFVAKHDNYLVYLAIFNAIDRVLRWVSEESKTEVSKQEILRNTQVNLYLLCPPQQSESKVFEKVLTENALRYINEFTKESITLNIKSVKMLSEGLAGFLGIILDMNTLGLSSSFASLYQQKTILFDFGGGTLNVIGIENGTLIDSIQASFQIGTSLILSKTQAYVNATRTNMLSESIFNDVMQNPVIKVGSDSLDVSEELETAILEVSDEAVSKITSYLKSLDIDLNTIENMVVLGGGAIPTAIGLKLPELLLSRMRYVIPNIELVDLSALDNSLSYEISESVDLNSPRYLNLAGLIKYVEIQIAKRRVSE